MTKAELQEVDNDVSCRQRTSAQSIVTSPIMYLCLELDRRPGPRVSKCWWKQDGLDVEGMRTAAWEAERTEGEEALDGTKTETDLVGWRIM